MKFLITLLGTLIFYTISFAEIDTLQLSDTLLIELRDQDATNIKSSTSKLAKEDILLINEILHQQTDEVYIQNDSALKICNQLIDNYFLVYKDFFISFLAYSTTDRSVHLEGNLRKYMTRLLFDLFYQKGTTEVLFREDVQEKLTPKVIDELFTKSYEENIFLKRLQFLSINSHVKLFNF